MDNDTPTTPTPRVRKPAAAAASTPTAAPRVRTRTTAPSAPTAPDVADAPEAKRPFLVGQIPLKTAVAIAGVTGLLGGGIGAGIAGLTATSFRTVVQPQAVTITTSGDITAATAVAAKSLQSVVTVEVNGQNGSGSGSGVIYSADGYIITNNHVASLAGTEAAPTIRVTLSDGRLFPASIVGTDPILDVAVIKVDATDLVPIEWADSTLVDVGSEVVAIGAPLGLQNTVTEGVVSAVNRSITINDQQGGNTFDLPGHTPTATSQALSLPVIQTDASINPGNSGGALLNANGELIGINVAIASSGQSNGSIGVGFALPSTLVQRVVTDIIANGKAEHGRIGALVSGVSASTGVIGAEVQGVDAGSPAAEAGLMKGDVITTFNGIPIRDEIDITAQVRSMRPGDTARFTYVRGGVSHDGSVTVGSLE